ncbi:MAG: PQQ-binding-like beta-propeller repeat protein [Phycisphaeraceae bacterium]
MKQQMRSIHSSTRSCLAIVCLLAILLAHASPAAAQDAKSADWPQFLGPKRTGVSSDTGLIDAWPEKGPREVWRSKGGVGMSGLAVSAGRVITLVQDDEGQHALALEAATGKQLWKTKVAPAYKNSQGDGPRATPAIADGRAFVFTGNGMLAALKADTGDLIWKHDTIAEFKGEIADFGMACSPLVVEGRVIVTVGAPGATVVAFDCDSGNFAWKTGNAKAGYSSPALLKVGGEEQLVVFTGETLWGIQPKSGSVLWSYPYKTPFDCNIATPIQYKDHIFISSGEDHGCALLSFADPASDGIIVVSEVWKSQGASSVMRNGWQTSLLIDGRLYGMDNVGAATSLTHFNCVDMATGKLIWQHKRFGNGNFIAADGKLILTTIKGELVLAKVSPQGFDELGRMKVLTSMKQGPALAGGLLYVRDDREIVCFDLRAK